MGTVYKDMNKDIEAFLTFRIYQNRLIPVPDIVNVHCYNHNIFHLHHYIKAQSYKNRMQWYKDNGIMEKLILMPKEMHEHLESPIYGLSDELFYKKYKIRKDLLLFDKKKWLDEQVRKENEL